MNVFQEYIAGLLGLLSLGAMAVFIQLYVRPKLNEIYEEKFPNLYKKYKKELMKNIRKKRVLKNK